MKQRRTPTAAPARVGAGARPALRTPRPDADPAPGGATAAAVVLWMVHSRAHRDTRPAASGRSRIKIRGIAEVFQGDPRWPRASAREVNIRMNEFRGSGHRTSSEEHTLRR